MDFKVVIPARYASTRLFAKPLLDLGGKPMVIRVAEQAALSGAQDVWIATDHPEVLAAAKHHGFLATMTRADHQSGTDRLAEVIEQQGWHDDTPIVNVQGDEPLIAPHLIASAARQLTESCADVATLAHPITHAADFFNPNIVKVVWKENKDALYFSRAPIPYARDHFAAELNSLPETLPAYRHIGLYAYRAGFLKVYAALTPSPFEKIEMLEQLRVLWHGFRISVMISDHLPMPGVDTEEDARKIQEHFRQAAC